MAQNQAHDDSDSNPHSSATFFPWHLLVFDAHCHPTDTIPGLAAALRAMRASALAIMATRAEDQELVADAAADFSVSSGCLVSLLCGQDGIATADTPHDAPSPLLFPAFGWHPWFSHQLYNDAAPTPTFVPPTDKGPEFGAALARAKQAHYRAILVPAPADADADADAFIASLPVPVALSSAIAVSRARLRVHAHALVGEVGLDKAFRLPLPRVDAVAAPCDLSHARGGREHRLLSPYRVRMSHQQAILRAQLALAAAERRPVSLHGVQAHGLLYDAVSTTWKGLEHHIPSRRKKRPGAHVAEDHNADDGDGNYPPRICLHSFSGSVELLQQWMRPSVPALVFVSFSAAINLGSDTARSKMDQALRSLPGGRILVESDLHVAGPRMDAALELMYRTVCHIKGWALDDGVRRIGRNFANFILGSSY